MPEPYDLSKPVRMAQISFYVHRDTREYCAQIAQEAGMSHSQLWASLAERLHQGGFSLAVFVKVGMQLHKRLKEQGAPHSPLQTGLWNPFEGLPPLPLAEEDGKTPIPPEVGAEMIEELNRLAADIKKRMKP